MNLTESWNIVQRGQKTIVVIQQLVCRDIKVSSTKNLTWGNAASAKTESELRCCFFLISVDSRCCCMHDACAFKQYGQRLHCSLYVLKAMGPLYVLKTIRHPSIYSKRWLLLLKISLDIWTELWESVSFLSCFLTTYLERKINNLHIVAEAQRKYLDRDLLVKILLMLGSRLKGRACILDAELYCCSDT